MNKAYLLIGGNLGNRSAYLLEAITHIQQICGNIVHSSAIYETAAWGKTDQPNFYNQALVVDTPLEPEKLMKRLLEIETTMGRKRTEKLGPRIIDLDILLIDGLVLHTNLLQIPHPAMAARKFVLLPLCEIAPDLIHPVYQKTIKDLLAACTDVLDVQKKNESGN
jgi:2-amino-4-hydroxy-6-hydroxymethyldihydropteridine diphosphokinase